MRYFLLSFLAAFLLSGCVKNTGDKLPVEKKVDVPVQNKNLEGFYVGHYSIEGWKSESFAMTKTLEDTFKEFKGIQYRMEMNLKFENSNLFKAKLYQEMIKDKTGLSEVPEALFKLTENNFELLYIKSDENFNYQGTVITEGGRTILRGQWTSTGFKSSALSSYSGNFELIKQQ